MMQTDLQSACGRVLVAEDSPTQAELLREVLAGAGYDVQVTSNAEAALAAARSALPCVIISDVVMPGMDGFALCHAVRADPALRHLPLMLVTSLNEPDDILRALESGADNFIRKPFEPDALLERLRYLIANRARRPRPGAQPPVEIELRGRRFAITACREQILDLLLASYQEAVQANEELRRRQDEVQSLNLDLAQRATELEDANRQLRSFSHSVSHDLRSPLATINGFSSILRQKYAGALEGNAARYLDAIEQESLRSLRIVDDILYLAGVEGTRIVRSRVDLAVLAREAFAALQAKDPQRRVRFECASTAPAECDERLVRVALANLIGNAWKFTRQHAQPRIAFAQHAVAGEPVFCVEDNGAGFDMAYAHRLFKPFERLHRAEEFEGHGVGLATVQRVVALHGGRIWADAAPGRGASFRFTLSGRHGAAGGSKP